MKKFLLSLLAVAACAHTAMAQCPPQQGWGQPGVSLSVGSGWGNQGIQWGINVGNQPVYQNNYPVAYPVAVPQAYPVQYPVAYPNYNVGYPVYQNAYPVCAPRRVYRASRNRRCR